MRDGHRRRRRPRDLGYLVGGAGAKVYTEKAKLPSRSKLSRFWTTWSVRVSTARRFVSCMFRFCDHVSERMTKTRPGDSGPRTHRTWSQEACEQPLLSVRRASCKARGRDRERAYGCVRAAHAPQRLLGVHQASAMSNLMDRPVSAMPQPDHPETGVACRRISFRRGEGDEMLRQATPTSA
jgi:hypothetical protein